MASERDIPVLLCMFNRPEPAAQVLNALRAIAPKRMFVAMDGPRPGHDDEPGVDACRALVDTIDWPCEIERDFSPVNLGLGPRLLSAMRWVFARADRLIMLEDDTVPHPSFFRFAAELLERYAEDERVSTINGTSAIGEWRRNGASYYFSNYFNSWGWAGWRRTIDVIDLEMTEWPRLREGDWLRDVLDQPDHAAAFSRRFDAAYVKRVNSWAYPLQLGNWRAGRVSITPATNLIANIGFGEAATHTAKQRVFHNIELGEMDDPIVHPVDVIVDRQADYRFFHKRILPETPIAKRMVQRPLRWAAYQLRGARPKPLHRPA
ncbi:MAG: hypothetical protein MI723_00430 [Caulobacterales bacterium]|nr:hypothetical protein [Caulobacterales bacterium]